MLTSRPSSQLNVHMFDFISPSAVGYLVSVDINSKVVGRIVVAYIFDHVADQLQVVG